MTIDPRAGTLPDQSMLVNVPRLVSAYYTRTPTRRSAASASRSARRAIAARRSTARSTNATSSPSPRPSVSTARRRKSTGPSSSASTPTRSRESALGSALEVLAANDVDVMIDARRLHADPGALARHPRLQSRPHGLGSPTASSSRRRTIRRRTAASSTIRPTAAPPTRASPAGSRIAPTRCSRRISRREAHPARRARDARPRRIATTTSTRTSPTCPTVVDLDAIRGVSDDARRRSTRRRRRRVLGRDRRALPVAAHRRERRQSIPTFRFMTVDWDGRIRMDCSSPYAMQPLDRHEGSLRRRVGVRHGSRSSRHRGAQRRPAESQSLSSPSCIAYLFSAPPGVARDAGIGKTVVSSSMIDRVAAQLGRPAGRGAGRLQVVRRRPADGSLGFGGEESAGASFLRRDGTVWTHRQGRHHPAACSPRR